MIATPEPFTTEATNAARSTTPIAIVGAGPYALSIAAHLRGRGIEHRIFGQPMETWRSNMPRGMHLKSEGFASSLSDPDGAFSLAAFCAAEGLPYADVGIPVSLDVFSKYGMAFAARYAPDLDTRKVTRLERAARGFALELEGGEIVRAERVILAVGISHFAWLPPLLAAMPREFVTHASAHRDLARFAGRPVAVIGAGATAVDAAGLLHANGAETHLVARVGELTFPEKSRVKRSLYERVRRPQSGLGPNIKSYLYCNFPDGFAALPPARRVHLARHALGPLPCYFTKDQIVGKVRMHLGRELDSVAIEGNGVALRTRDRAGNVETLACDHIIAGTGYRVDMERLAFLPAEIRTDLKVLDGSPVLDRNFQSSVDGLYFVGLAAAVSFGPMLRFAFGARFAATRLAAHVARTASSARTKNGAAA